MGKLAVLIFVGAAFYFFFFIEPQQALDTESAEARTVLSSVFESQKNYYSKWKKYSADLKQIGYVPEAKSQTLVYIRESDIPGAVFEKIPSEALPFAQDQNYRVLAVFADKLAYTIDKSGKLTRHDLLKQGK